MNASFEHTITHPGAQQADNPKANKEYDDAPDIFGAVGDYPGMEIFVKIFYSVNAFVFHKIMKAKVKIYYLP